MTFANVENMDAAAVVDEAADAEATAAVALIWRVPSGGRPATAGCGLLSRMLSLFAFIVAAEVAKFARGACCFCLTNDQ